MNKEFWSNKKIFLTGHTGFKGSWLSIWLQSLKSNLTGYSLTPPTSPSLFKTAMVERGMHSITGDVRDFNYLKETIAQYEPEIVIHMAAQSLVRYSYDNPLDTFSTNIMGTVNILEAVRQTKSVKVVLIITSDKCYRNNEWIWGYRENEPMGGHDPYSSSKGCAEIVSSAFRHSYFSVKDYDRHGVAVASARAGNVIGGGDWSADRLIPDIIKAFMENQPVIIRSPESIRPWQHVLEPLHGYLCLIEKLWEQGPAFAGGWNFGPNDDDVREVSWIVEKIANQWGDHVKWELDKSENPHEAQYLKLDCSKAKSNLRWRPKLDLNTSLEWIINWYRNYKSGKDMRSYTESEIARYENL